MILKKIISGGQTGADIGGLEAARCKGILTGGWAPKDWQTEDGPNTALGTSYGLKEHQFGYRERTIANIKDSDATVIFASNLRSRGTELTINQCVRQGKPHLVMISPEVYSWKEVVTWIKERRIEVLNVVGNRESVSKGIAEFTQGFMSRVLDNFQGQ